MKKLMNDNQPSPDWLEQAVQAHLAAKFKRPKPSQEFRARCRSAAHGALGVLRMQQQRSQYANAPGSLGEHFATLAHSANVSLEAVFNALGIRNAEATGETTVRGLAKLAQYVGLARDEVVLRVRWGVAQIAGGVPTTTWPGTKTSVPVRRRPGLSGKKQTSRTVKDVLAACERKYSPAHRAELRVALNVIAEVYG